MATQPPPGASPRRRRRAHPAAVVRLGFGSLVLLALLVLYLEESGLPLGLPGDVCVMYVGHRAAGQPLTWLASWLGLIGCVLLGASNLYLISRRWGHRLLEGRLGRLLHLDQRRLAQGERWFARWGIWAIRHRPAGPLPLGLGAHRGRLRSGRRARPRRGSRRAPGDAAGPGHPPGRRDWPVLRPAPGPSTATWGAPWTRRRTGCCRSTTALTASSNPCAICTTCSGGTSGYASRPAQVCDTKAKEPEPAPRVW